jgi:CheY-like chemotaxis protein
MKILIVDDEPLVRLSLRRALEKHGHQVSEAEDGQSGQVQWLALAPELVYLDVLMPRMSGPDLLKAMTQTLKSQDKTMGKVVLMSAFTGEYDFERAKSLGADMFVLKPFEDIFAVVRLGEELVNG